MTTRILISTVTLFALGCSSGDGSKTQATDDTSTDTAGEATTSITVTNGFQLTGQEGSLIAVHSARSVQAAENFTASAMFADTLQGIITPNWCTSGRPCITTLPAIGANEAFATNEWDPEASVYNWVGNEMFVGSLKLLFVNDFERGVAYYTGTEFVRPDTDVVSIQISGEWGEHATDDFLIPPPVTITSPDPLVAVGMAGVIPFRWTPPISGQIYLRFEGGGTDRVFQLENTGSFDLNTTLLGAFDPAEVEIFFGVWAERNIDVNGNGLRAFGAWEQPFQGTECTAYPAGQLVGGVGSPAGPDMRPSFVTMGFDGVIDNDRFYDYYNDSNGDGVAEVYSAAVFFDFYEADPVNPANVGPHLCQVVYDASTNQSTNFISTSGLIYSAFDVMLADGISDCNSLDAGIWNFVDVRDVLQSNAYNWGFGIGEVQAILPNLEVKYDPDWAIWEPLIVGGYISFDGVFAYEWDEVHVYPLTECATVQPDKTEIDAPLAGPVFNADYTGIPMFAFPFLPPP